MRGHLYCSTRCARDAGRVAFWNRMREQFVRPVSSRLAVLVVILAVSAPTLAALRAVSELDRLNTQSPVPPPRRAPAVRIDSIEPAREGTRIEGTAPAGTAVFLFAGGEFAGAALAGDGRFRFQAVRQPGPYRVGALSLSLDAGGSAPSLGVSEETNPRPADSPASAREAGETHGLVRERIPDFVRGPRDRREIVLSFDGGSSDRGAREILAALRARHLKTTIFLTGEFIRRYPELTLQIAADGHEVGNHTDTHPHLTTYAQDGRQATRPGLDRASLTAELSRTARLYRETTGHEIAPLWRAPYGEQNAEVRRWAAEAGYWHVGWTGGRAGLDGLDWVSDPRSPSYRSAEHVIERLVEHAENGGIVLLHLGSDREDPVALKIPRLLDGLSRRGFRLALASEFLERDGFTDQRLAQLAKRTSLTLP